MLHNHKFHVELNIYIFMVLYVSDEADASLERMCFDWQIGQYHTLGLVICSLADLNCLSIHLNMTYNSILYLSLSLTFLKKQCDSQVEWKEYIWQTRLSKWVRDQSVHLGVQFLWIWVLVLSFSIHPLLVWDIPWWRTAWNGNSWNSSQNIIMDSTAPWRKVGNIPLNSP